jgi:hypothetical protein
VPLKLRLPASAMIWSAPPDQDAASSKQVADLLREQDGRSRLTVRRRSGRLRRQRRGARDTACPRGAKDLNGSLPASARLSRNPERYRSGFSPDIEGVFRPALPMGPAFCVHSEPDLSRSQHFHH